MTQELKHDIKKIDIGLNMTDWAKYATKPDDEVAMVPFWLFEAVRLIREKYTKRLALAVGVLAVALIVAIVWR